MRKQSWVEESGASRGNGSFVRHAKVFGIKTMATVMTASMILSGVPVQAIAEGIQTDDTFVESNVESSQGDTAATANDASSGQASDQGTTENNSAVQDDAADSGQNTQTSQAVSQDKATTADIALALNNASITYQGQVIAQPSQKVTAPASVDFKFSVTADNGFKLNEAKLTVDGVETKLKADANGEYTVPAAEVAKSPKVTLETEQEKQAETTGDATPIEQNATDTNAVAVQAATDADYTVEVGDSITLKATGASNSGWWSFSDWSIISQTTSGNKAELATRGVGRVTATYTYQDSRWQNQTKTFVVDIIDRKDATTPGIEGPSSVVVDSEFELTETKNASEWEWHLIGDGDYTAARIDSGAGTKKIKLTALYQFAGDGKVVTVQCKYKVPGTNNTVYSDTFNVTIRKRQWKVADWTYVDGTYKAIPTIVDVETNEPVKEWQTGFQVTYYINGEDKGCNPWSGDFFDPNKTYEVKIAPFGDQGWNSKYSGEAKTFDDPVPVKDRTPIASDSPSNVDYEGQEHKWAPTATDKNTRETLDDTEYDVIYKRDGKETGDFTSPGKITVEIKGKHHHKGEIEKTYTIREKQIKLSVSGPDTVEQFNTIQLTPTLEPAQKGGTYTWTSNNENILTVDKNGKVTGVSEGKATVTVMWTSADGKTVLIADHVVTVTHTTSGKTDAMFFYLNDPSGQLDSTNTGNWQTLGKGKINLTGYNNSNFPKDNGATKKYDAQARVTKWPGGSTSSKLDVERGSNDWNKIVKMYQSVIKSQLPNVEVKDSDIESIELLPYKLTRNNDGYHVDCQVVVKCKGLYTVKYWVDDPTASGEGYQQVAVTTTAREGDSTNISDFNQSYPETKTVNGVEYTFSGWFLDAALTKSASLPYVVRNSNLNFYAKYVAGRMVMYDLQGGSWKSGAGTTYKVNAGKTHTVLTEPKREGYEFEGWKVSGLGDQISVNSGDMFTMPDNNVTITAQWKKKSATVTVKYLWGDKDSHELIESDKLAGDYSFDDVIDVADVAKDFDGYTIKPSKSTKRVLDAGENVINIYYYKNVTLTAKSAGKTYNGEQQALEGYTTSEGAAKFDDITAKGSGTNAGEYTVAFNEGAQGAVSKDAKYIVSETVSDKLTITPVTDKVTITVKGHKGDKKYNGKEQTVEGYDIDASTSPAGVVKSDVKYSGTASVSKTDAGKYAMGLKDTQFSLSGDAAKNYTNVKFEVVDGELNIARKDVTLKSDDLSKGYDGTALTNNGAALKTEEGFVKGEGATYAFSGSQTTVGSSANAFTYALNSNTKAENYNITKTEGKLEVTDRSQKYEITVTANSDTQTYTGTEHSVSGLSGTTFTNDKGVTYTVEGLSASVSGTDAGEYTNKVSGTAVVKDAQGNDVTSQFNVKTVDGKLTINKREVTIKPKDVSKVYDGNALVAKDWVVAEGSFVDGQGIANPKYTGFQTAPGTSESGISEWGYKDGTNSNNYDIKSAPGTLNVTSRGATQTITVEANSADASYDGNEHSAKGLKTNEFEVDGKKYTVSGLETSSPTKTDAGTYDNNITGTAKVTDAQGNDVTSEFKVETKNGTLTIAKADVTIVPKDASKPYDGQPLTATDFTATGFIGNDTVTSVVYGGSQTEAGTSTSSITSYEAAKGTNLGNYNITKGSGTLEVTASQKAVVVKVKGNIDTKKYDGIEKNISGFTVTDVTVDGQESKLYGAAAGTDFTFSGIATAARTDVGTTNMGLAADQFANVNKNFANVTFEVVEDGSVTVTPREVTLTSATDEKPYDGTALTNSNVTVSGDGFAQGEGFTANVTGSQTNAGSSDNTFTYSFNKDTSAADYWVTPEYGKLIVTADDNEVVVTVTEHGGSAEYDGTEKSVSGYDFKASNELYKDTDFTFSGTDTVKGTNVGTYDMELKSSDFTNNNQNFSKVTFVIVDGQLTITPKGIKAGDNMAVEAPAGVVYNGKSQQQKPVVKDGDKTLVEGTDYALSYSEDTTNAGTVTVTVTGMGNYTGTTEVIYQIAKRKVALESEGGSKPFDGTPLTKPEVAGWQQAGDTGFVTGEVSNVRATGSVTTVAEGEVTNTIGYDTNANFKKGNYSITKKEGKLSITSLSAEDGLTIKPKNAEYTYDADSHTAGKASASASVNGIKVNLEYRVKGSADSEWRADPSQITAINAGTLTVEVRASADNYSGYQYAEQTLTINKRDVELTSASASKVYDGTALTKDWVDMGPNRKGTGFIGTDLAGDGQVHATGSQTEVGSSDNTISYQLKKGKENNYNIMDNKLGTLEVTAQSIVPDPENPDGYKGVTISSPSSSVYDGNEHKWVPEVKDVEGNALKEGTDYTVSYDTDNFVDAKKITVTITGKGNYCGSVTKTYKITKAPLKVSAKSASKVYDGSALTAGGTIKGLVGDETATVKTEGSQTEVGSSDNKFVGIEWDGTAKEGNYYIQSQNDGVLTVTAKGVAALEVGTLSDVVYSGVDQAQKPEVKDGVKTLKEGTDYKVSFSEDVKNVGTVTVTVTGKGNYNGTVERTYQITPAKLTVTTPSKSKVYNGKALTAEGTVSGFVNGEAAAFATTGSQTKVGSSTNTYAIDWGAKESTAKKSNYTVAENLGTLTVTEFAGEVVATAGNYNSPYDGQAHGVDVTVTGLPEGYTVKSAVSNATATDATEDKVKAEVDDLVIVNADGEDVTSELKITKKTGAIEITPAPLKVTTYGAKAEYNGRALTAGGKVTGFVNNEAASFTATGSQTEVGKSKNTYKIDWNDTAKESNYTVEEDLGTLEVTKNMAAVMVIPNGGSKVYDGKVLESDGVTTYGLPSGYTLEAKTKGSVTNVGSATAEVESYTIKNAAGKDVTDQFGNVATGKATLEVSKRPVTVASATDSKVYDGSAVTKHEASVTAGSLAKGEIFTYDFTGEQTVVGSTANSFTVKAGENTNLDNYKISKADGTLTVTAKSIVPDPSDEHNKMSVDAPASVKYDGNAHKWIPTVKDGDKTLKEGTDYTVSYSKDDFTNVTGVITVTIAGKGNYTGMVSRTYEITKRSVKLTGVKNVTKVYDGTALEAKDVTVTGDGFIEGEGTDIKATGSVTEVTAKPVENPIEFTAGKGFKEGNYTIEKDPGTLQVTARSIDDAAYGMSVSKPESVEYDGQAHKWAPTVKDGEKTLAEGADYTVAYGKDDFTNVTGEIKVTITGMGNYAGSVERAYQITPAPLTVKTEGAAKVYDGEALTHDVATIKGLKNKETATIHATGSQTEVGESDNGYAITWDGSAQKDNYTIKTETIGKLVVSETADQITATPVNVETTYDGNAHGTTVQVTGLPKGYTVKKAESKATATNVADGEVKATVDELVIVNAQGKDVTSKLNIKRGTATIKVNPAPLTVTTDGGEKEYDGTALTANGIKVEGLKGKDSVSAKTTGSRTKAGSSNNTYEINWKDTKKSNYKVTDVLGTLKVTPSTKAVTLTSGSASRAYSGHALTSDEIKAEGLPEGFTVKAEMDGAQTDAGSSKNTVKSYKILDAKGDDVTDMFANVTVKTGTLTVSPKEITVETEGAIKVYDGEELTNKNGAIHGLVSGEHADVVTNGTQTNVGSSDNGYTIAWGTAKEGNYTIASDALGKLVVTPQSVNPNDPSYHKLQVSNPADLTYDGQTHKWAPEVKDYTGTELKEGVDYTLAYDTDDFINAGSITVTVVGKGNYTGTVSRTYRIKPAPVSIKTESAARVYNGKALTAGGAITGLVNGETVDFRVTGSQTKVGHSANTYKLAWTGTARETNYTVVSIELGTLTVTESEDTVVVTTTGGTFTYDGNAHGATVAVSQLPEGYTVDGTPSSDATATDANGDGVKATVDHLVIRNAEGEDVTSKLNIKKVDGTIKVLPAELTVTTDSATKVYDGTALTAGATVTGLVGDEEATLEATGKQTQVGSSSNGYKLTFDKTAKDKNYKVVSENLGTLTVTKQSIVPSEPGTPSDNYKGVTVDDPKDAVYDGVEHKWTPVVKDAEGKTLVEGTDYVVSYDTDDFIDVATTNVTITGKGNYAGTIAKSYRITKAPLHVVTGSATKVYDGQALTSATVTIDGLAKRDRIGVAVTGSQTNVGSSQNTYAIDWMQTSADNYELTDELGTLTVAAAPARPTTPSTPVTPTTPTTPTVPNPTPNGSDGGSTATTTAPKSDGSSDSNDQEQKEEKIFDAKNPLGKFDGKKDTCWVHWYMIICAVATAAYGLFVGLRRDKHSRRLQNDLDEVLGNDDETQE